MRGLTLAVGVVLVALSASPAAGQNALTEELQEGAQEIEDLQQQMEDASLEANYWTDQVAATSSRLHAILDDLTRAEAVLIDLELSIVDVEGSIDVTQSDIFAKEAELSDTQVAIAETHEKVVTQAVELFKAGSNQAEVIFDYKTAQDAAVAVRYGTTLIEETNRALATLKELRGQKEQQVVLIEDQKSSLEADKAVLEKASSDAELQRQIVEENWDKAETELINQRALLQTVKTEISHFESELDALEGEQERLKALLAAAQSSSGLAPAELYPPLDGPVVSAFGPRLHPILGYTRMHTGIDIDGSRGADIFAAASGTVILAGSYGGYGNAVIIDHGGGMATLYAHQSSIVVSKGQKVLIADLVGYVGSTGLSTGPHLHFEVRLSGNPVDPASYFG
ncbi:MAG: peptidoglycan DD-metalloendopeptidase family protein [Acidimicrobiia bacterium]